VDLKRSQLDHLTPVVADLGTFHDGSISSNSCIILLEGELFADLTTEKWRLQMLHSQSKQLKILIVKTITGLVTIDSQCRWIANILDVSAGNYDLDISYLLPSSHQDNLQMLLEYDQFPISEQFRQLIKEDGDQSHEYFITQIIEIVYAILEHCGLPKIMIMFYLR
jgi:hypothetical protein